VKVAVIGASGQLGIDVAEEFVRQGMEVCRLSHEDIEISNKDSVSRVLNQIRPTVVINTAAMHRVESCEENAALAYNVNAIGARNLAIATHALHAALVHVSTDYVFDGLKQSPYLETDHATPLNVYGSTKLAGELFVQAGTDKHFILRTSALYGKNPCRAKGGRNFVELMLKLSKERDELRVVDDEVISPTSTSELAKQIFVLAQTRRFGLYHATSEGSCSWFQFAAKIFELANVKVNLVAALPNEFPAKVPRPKYSVLENQGLKVAGLNSFGTWESGLRTYLTSVDRASPTMAASVR
jgi:dTDP-4-dehydrorhamnose reductase